MNELGPDARAILDAARDAHDPDAATRARIRSAVLRRVGAGAIVATTVATAGKSAAAPVSAMLAKLLAIAALATGGAFLARQLTPPTTQPEASATGLATQPLAPATGPATTLMKPQPVIPVITPEPLAKPKPESTLKAELQALRDAHLALREGRASDALSIVDAMKGSSLAQERAATRALALCALGRADARASAESFLAAHPSSPLGPRVRTACAIP